MNPLTYTFVFAGSSAAVYAINGGTQTVNGTNTRAGKIPTEKLINEASVDRYSFIKNAYQQHREYLLHDGNGFEQDELQMDDEVSTKGTGVAKGVVSAESDNSSGLDNSKHFLDLSAPVLK